MYLPCACPDGMHGAHTLRSKASRLAHYPIPVHLQPAYADLGYGPGSFPNAEAVARDVLSLPLFPELTDAQVDRVAALFVAGLAPAAGHG